MIGHTLGHYEITALLGKGGMGEVYRARDTKLGREVAIKILPRELSADPERVARFQREAQTLAALQHPNVASIYGFENTSEACFLVMELVEGEDLQTRLQRGALSIEDSIAVGVQIAEGLEAAHERGIVHRDLKPANVVRSSDGTVKVLDFGLARAYTPDDSQLDLENSPTITAAMTREGVILGTAAYMSPEQARGRGVDRRTDIWAFGVILMEMLTGRRLFEGETVSDTMAEVLKARVDLDALPPRTPAKVRALLARCLDRDPKTRLRDIGEARVLLSRAPADEPKESASAGRPSRMRGLLAGAVLGAVVGVFVIWLWMPASSPAPTQSVRFEIPVPNPPQELHCAFDPEGRRIVFNDSGQLHLRHLDDPQARPIPNTEGAMHTVWSPDGQWIAFNVGVDIYKIQPDGSRRFLVCAVDDPIHPVAGSLTWMVDDHLLIVQGDGGLLRVSALGGTPEIHLSPRPDELDFHAASELPAGAGILFGPHSERKMNDVDLLDDEGRKTVHSHGPNSNVGWPQYSAGHLLYVARRENPGIWAVPYSISERATGGAPVLLIPDGDYVASSPQGHLAYTMSRQDRDSDLVIVDREGRSVRTIISQQSGLAPQASLSPDGTEVAVTIRGDDDDIWIYEVADGTRRRVVFGDGMQAGPVWAPDGRRLAYAVSSLFNRRPRLRDLGTASDAAICSLAGRNFSFSENLEYVAYGFQTAQLDWNVGYTNLETGESGTVVGSLASEDMPSLSPDGRYIAYQSDESGRTEIYLGPFPEGPGRWRVSEDGGEQPFWSVDGTSLYFRARTTLMEVPLTTSPGLVLGEPREVFTRPRMDWIGRGSDGQFLVHELGEFVETEESIVVWMNWAAGRQ